jgi:DNA-binding HxlR family transcriptional regulator
MEKRYHGITECPITATIDIIGGKWKPIIIWLLMEKTHRFGELHKTIPGMALKVLSRQLKELEGDGIVKRAVFAEVPPRVEYSLTAKGQSLSHVMTLLSNWSKEHILAPAVNIPSAAMAHRTNT